MVDKLNPNKDYVVGGIRIFERITFTVDPVGISPAFPKLSINDCF